MSALAIATPGSVQRNVEKVKHPEQDIANLAYALWQQRGSPEGSAEEDWKEAERQLHSRPVQKVSSGRR
jgi:hypothetical protein